MPTDLFQLRRQAISHSLFRPTSLKAAVDRLGFVQADPIRSPAAAQDLILRHRVKGYRAGDLEAHYSSLGLEEDVLYAYGFLPRHIWQSLHPRTATPLPEFDQKVLAMVRSSGPVHPRELEAHFGRARVINAWGGQSRATKCALERLHYRGLLRIAQRQDGTRIYAPAPPLSEQIPPRERFRRLILVIANILAPVSEKTLQAIAAPLHRRSAPEAPSHRKFIGELLQAGELKKCSADNLVYLWPASNLPHDEPPHTVRFLAPFDPLVWDRRRFEHFWHWSYRFEAYTPPARRVRGYYAMPLLWGEDVIGWVNAAVTQGKLRVKFGFTDKRPGEPEFWREAEAEVARLERFLGLKNSAT